MFHIRPAYFAKVFVVFGGALMCILFAVGCAREPVTGVRFLFGARCSIVIPGSEKNARQAIEHAYSRLAEIDAKFNVLISTSPLSEFNNSGVPIRDPEIIRVARSVARFHDASDGVLEPRVYPLVQLWHFYSDNPVLPRPQDIQSLLPLVQEGKIMITDQEIRAGQKGVGLDFGAVVSGYAADEAVRILKADGIKNALVDTGGEFYALGRSQPDRKWRIGVKNPRGEGIIGVIEVENEGLATSGDYEKFIMVNGTRYHHILNPATGYSARGLESVTVIAPTAFAADAWSTAFFVLGKEIGFKKISQRPGFKAVVVDDTGQLQLSPEVPATYTDMSAAAKH